AAVTASRKTTIRTVPSAGLRGCRGRKRSPLPAERVAHDGLFSSRRGPGEGSRPFASDVVQFDLCAITNFLLALPSAPCSQPIRSPYGAWCLLRSLSKSDEQSHDLP